MSAKKTQRLGEISPVTEKLSEQALIDELAAFDRYECISVELNPFGRRAVSAHTVFDSFEVERVGALLAKIFYNSDTGSSLTIFSEIACAEKAPSCVAGSRLPDWKLRQFYAEPDGTRRNGLYAERRAQMCALPGRILLQGISA